MHTCSQHTLPYKSYIHINKLTHPMKYKQGGEGKGCTHASGVLGAISDDSGSHGQRRWLVGGIDDNAEETGESWSIAEARRMSRRPQRWAAASVLGAWPMVVAGLGARPEERCCRVWRVSAVCLAVAGHGGELITTEGG